MIFQFYSQRQLGPNMPADGIFVWRSIGQAPVTPPTPSGGLTTNNFAGFGGGFLGPYHKARRPKKEVDYETPPVYAFDKSSLFPKFLFPQVGKTWVMPVVPGAIRTQVADFSEPPRVYRIKMTKRMRELLAETPEQTKIRKRKKRQKEEEEFLMRLL